jgi:hypothetical protein
VSLDPQVVEWPNKAPGEVVRYGLDFVDRLDAGATIASASWAETPNSGGGGTLVLSSGVAGGSTIASILVSGGALGDGYTVACTATTSDGQTLKQTAILRIVGR